MTRISLERLWRFSALTGVVHIERDPSGGLRDQSREQHDGNLSHFAADHIEGKIVPLCTESATIHSRIEGFS